MRTRGTILIAFVLLIIAAVFAWKIFNPGPTAFAEGSTVALADYRAAFRRPEVRAAIIKDYQASDNTDFANDAADRAAGRKIICPVLVLWPDERLVAESAGGVAITAGEVWRRWADDVSAVAVSCGHMIPEHAATEVVRAVLPFFEAAADRDLDVLTAGPAIPQNVRTQ